MKNKLTKGDAKKLADFLSKHQQDGALSLLETQGFLFGVACCPGIIMPSQWLPRVTGEDTAYSSKGEVQLITGSLFALYNQIIRQVTAGTPKFPKECRILPDPLKNFESPAPIHQWSCGFMNAHHWLKNTWEAALEGEELTQFNMTLFVLGAPANRRVFEDVVQDKSPEEQRAMVKDMLETMPDALQTFAILSETLRDREHPKPHGDDLH